MSFKATGFILQNTKIKPTPLPPSISAAPCICLILRPEHHQCFLSMIPFLRPHTGFSFLFLPATSSSNCSLGGGRGGGGEWTIHLVHKVFN